MSKKLKNRFSFNFKEIARIGIPLIFICLLVLGLEWRYEKKVAKIKRTHKVYRKYFTKGVIDKGVLNAIPLMSGVSLPFDLRHVPFGELNGVVLGSKKVDVRDITAPYNASIIANGDRYLLFFRYDTIDHTVDQSYFSSIGCVELDENFEQTNKEFVKIETSSIFSEDPRVLKSGDNFYLIYNEQEKRSYNCRTMRIAQLNLENYQLNYITNLDLQRQPIEKNWPPFEYTDENGKTHIHFEYQLSPHVILKLPNARDNSLTQLTFSQTSAFQKLFWPNTWGAPRGGTPALKVDGQYLAFFHSSFKDKDGYVWYVMGAYTFEDHPPFRVTGISNYPILFEGIYNTPPMNTALGHLRAIYPSGFVVENRNGREVIHVSCGENDSAVKIVTLDKAALLKNLKKI